MRGWPVDVNKGFKIAGVFACFIAVLLMNGGQWFALQTFAWARMTVEFAKQDSLGSAITKTFSGRYPCPLCLKVRAGVQQQKEQEKKSPWLKTDKLPEVVWEVRSLTAPPIPTVPAAETSCRPEFYSSYTEAPPVPPPRA